MSRDTLKLTTSQWTALFEAIHYTPQSDVLDQIALEISTCVDLNFTEARLNESTMIIRANNRHQMLDEKTKHDLSKLDFSKMENIK